MWRFHLAILLLVCIVGADPATAQVSCNAVRAISGPLGYRHLPDSERCEGIYQEQVSGSFQFLSLVNGQIDYDLVSNKNLIVSVPALPPKFSGSQVFLMARALWRETPYRMDAIVPSAGTFKWPLGAVLKQLNLQADSLGVVAWINQPLGKYYVPISVVADNVAPAAERKPVMIVRPSLDVQLLQWRIRPESGGSGSGDYINVGGEHPAIIRQGQPVLLPISGQPNSPSVVDLAAYYVNSSKPDTQLIRLILP